MPSLMPQTEQASTEKRHWVRLTKFCNNNCIFCLDKESHDGKSVPYESVLEDLKRGMQEKAERAILSGGEPTIHPKFFDIVAFSKKLGYKKVQVITNGRMFAYHTFFENAVKTGVDEITFSMHGHTKEIHDGLTGIKGSFAQALKGLMAALRSRRLIVNVDVVVNKRNYLFLPEMIYFFHKLGVQEFDLLHVVPFGNAWKNKENLFYELEQGLPYLHEAFQYASEKGIRIWTNRFPPEYLEGYEHLIQSPMKILDEVRGREELFSEYLYNDKQMPCLGERCDFCFIRRFCDELALLKEQVKTGSMPAVLVHAGNAGNAHIVKKLQPQTVYLSGVTPQSCQAFRDACKSVIVWISSPEEWKSWKNVKDVSFEILINKQTNMFVSRNIKSLMQIPQVSLSLQNIELTENVFPLACFFRPIVEKSCLSLRVVNMPPCLYHGSTFTPSLFYDLNVFREDLTIDLRMFAHSFIQHKYKVKSIRCRACMFFDACEGLPLAYIIASGFSQLVPQNRPYSGNHSFVFHKDSEQKARGKTAKNDERFSLLPLEKLLAYLQEKAADWVAQLDGWELEEIYPWGNPLIAFEFSRKDTMEKVIFAVGAPDKNKECLLHAKDFNFYCVVQQRNKLTGNLIDVDASLSRRLCGFLYSLPLLGNMLDDCEKYYGVSGMTLNDSEKNASCVRLSDKKYDHEEWYRIWVGTTCDYNCVFCSLKDNESIMPEREMPLRLFKQGLQEGRRKGLTALFLSGFETLNYKNIFYLLKFARKEGYKKIKLFTTGIKLHERAFSKQLIKLMGDDWSIHLPIYGDTPLLHDAVTNLPGSFNKLMKGISNIIKEGGQKNIHMSCVIVKQNYRHIHHICERVAKLGIQEMNFRLPYPLMESRKDRYSRIAVRISAAIPYILACKESVDLDITYPCIFLMYLLRTKKFVYTAHLRSVVSFLMHLMTYPDDDDMLNMFSVSRKNLRSNWNKVCFVPCAYRNTCVFSPYCTQWIYRKYLLQFGSKGFQCISEKHIRYFKEKFSDFHKRFSDEKNILADFQEEHVVATDKIPGNL